MKFKRKNRELTLWIQQERVLLRRNGNGKEDVCKKQTYYIDSQEECIYRVEENADFLRTELYYIGNL